MIASVHIDNYMQKAMGVSPEERGEIFEANKQNKISAAQAFEQRDMTSDMQYDLTDLILNRSIKK